MDNVKGNQYYLKKALADLRFLIEHTQGITIEELEHNLLLLDSVMFRMIQIAENVDKLTSEFKATRQIPWKAIKGMRNKIVHDYGIVDLKIVYDTVINDIPNVYRLLVEANE